MRKKPSSCSARWSSRARLATTLAVASSLAQLGCSTTCDNDPNDNPPQIYLGGKTSGDVYESSPPTSGLLPFPGGKQYFLVHHLGFTPTYPTIYFGLAADGTDLNPCAGNTCLVPCVNSEFIWLRNDTCADFLVRVVTTARSTFQQGTECPGDASISLTGTADASLEASVIPLDGSEASSPIIADAAIEAPSE